MSSSYIEDLGKLMDKPIVYILFFATLELNIVDKENKKKCDSCGKQINPSLINPSQMQIVIFLPNEDCIISNNVKCHCCYITITK
jgi:hypothetical protein